MIEIRVAQLADIARIMELGEEFAKSSPNFSRLRFSKEQTVLVLELMIGHTDPGVFVAYSDGVIVGGLVACIAPAWFSTDICTTDIAFYVDKEFRKSTVAARLVKQYVKWAKRQNAYIIELTVTSEMDTERVKLFFKRMGFREIGAVMQYESK